MVAKKTDTPAPTLQVPAGWLLAEAHGSFSHQKRKYMALMLLAARDCFTDIIPHESKFINMYGEDENEYAGICDEALSQLAEEGYIEIEEGYILISEKTRNLFGLGGAE